MPASTTMDKPQQREENKRAYIYIYVLQQRCHYMKIHSTFNHSPRSKKKNSETSDTNQRSKIQRHYHTNTSNQPNTPNKIKKENQNKNVPRNLQSPHIPHRPRFHTHLRSISSHSRPLRVSHHPSHHYIPLTITSLPHHPSPSPPLLASHLLTHIYKYSLKFGTLASKSIEGRFRAFDDRARDSLPVEERRHRFQRMREGREL